MSLKDEIPINICLPQQSSSDLVTPCSIKAPKDSFRLFGMLFRRPDKRADYYFRFEASNGNFLPFFFDQEASQFLVSHESTFHKDPDLKPLIFRLQTSEFSDMFGAGVIDQISGKTVGSVIFYVDHSYRQCQKLLRQVEEHKNHSDELEHQLAIANQKLEFASSTTVSRSMTAPSGSVPNDDADDVSLSSSQSLVSSLRKQRDTLRENHAKADEEKEKWKARCQQFSTKIEDLQKTIRTLEAQVNHLSTENNQCKQLLQDRASLATRTKTGTVLNSVFPLPDDLRMTWESIVSDILLEPIVTIQVNPVTLVREFLYSVQNAAYQIVHDKEVQCLRAMGYEWSDKLPALRNIRRQLQDSYDIWKIHLMDHNPLISRETLMPESIRESLADILTLFAAGQLSDPKIQLEDQEGLLVSEDSLPQQTQGWADSKPPKGVNLEDVHLIIPALKRGDHLLSQRQYFWNPDYKPKAPRFDRSSSYHGEDVPVPFMIEDNP